MIKILHVVPSLDSGGIEKLITNYYEYFDKSEFKFDFIVHGEKIGMLEKVLIDKGCHIFHLPSKKAHPIKYVKLLKSILQRNNYNIVHSHQDEFSFVSLFCAKSENIQVRIAHVHLDIIKGDIVTKLFKILTKLYSTEWFSCSESTGRRLYGDKPKVERKVYNMKNAIEVDLYKYNLDIRKDVQSRLGIENNFVVGSVARFDDVKNHTFLIDIFKEVRKNEENAVLLLVGSGELERVIHEKVKDLGLEDSVFFLGKRNDVNNLYQAMDVFLLPSKLEGLPISLVEAQCSGLKCVISSNITHEIDFTKSIDYVSLQESAATWARIILENKNYKRNDQSTEAINMRYNISTEAMKLQEKYEHTLVMN